MPGGRSPLPPQNCRPRCLPIPPALTLVSPALEQVGHSRPWSAVKVPYIKPGAHTSCWSSEATCRYLDEANACISDCCIQMLAPSHTYVGCRYSVKTTYRSERNGKRQHRIDENGATTQHLTDYVADAPSSQIAFRMGPASWVGPAKLTAHAVFSCICCDLTQRIQKGMFMHSFGRTDADTHAYTWTHTCMHAYTQAYTHAYIGPT